MWKFSIHNTISGAKLLDIEPSSGAWRRALGGGGDGQHTLKLREGKQEITPTIARQLSEPNQASIAVRWDDTVLYAGTISQAVYSRDNGELTIHHDEGIRGLLRNRTTFGVGGGYADGHLVVTNRSAAGAVRAILFRGAGGTWGATWDLPIDLPADAAGAISFTWRRWDYPLIDDLLGQVEALGWEIDFRPYLNSNGTLRYETIVGSRIAAGTLEFVLTAEKTPVRRLTVTRDGSKQLSGVFVLGKGSEDKMLRGEAGFVAGPTIPVRDAVRSRKDVSSQARLTDMAMADLLEHRSPTEQWDFSLVAEVDGDAELLDVGGLIPGATMRLLSSGDNFIPDGTHSMRMVAVRGDMTRTLKPEVQP